MQIALDLLKKCSSQGTWLCLKNLHLVTSWLTTLEKVNFFRLENIRSSSFCFRRN